MSDRERKEAMLTETQREFLRGEKEYQGKNAKQQRYQMRERIRRRVRDTLLDFSLLYEYADERERNAIFDIGESITDTAALSAFQDALADTVAFLYRSLEGEPDSKSIYERSFRIPFKDILQQGIAKAEADRRPREESRMSVNVDLTVDVSNMPLMDPDRGIEKIARFQEHELTESELRTLIFAFNPGSGGLYRDHGYAELADRVKERRDELGIETDPLTEEEKEQISEELSSNHEADDENS